MENNCLWSIFSVVPVHGVPASLEGLISATDYIYPNHTAVDFKAGGKLCSGGQY